MTSKAEMSSSGGWARCYDWCLAGEKLKRPEACIHLHWICQVRLDHGTQFVLLSRAIEQGKKRTIQR